MGDTQIKANLSAVTVHAGQQQLACAKLDHFLGPLHRIQAGGATAAVGENLPAVRLAFLRHFFSVNRHHNALAAKTLGGFTHKLRVRHRRGVDRDLIRPSVQHGADIVAGTNAAADG